MEQKILVSIRCLVYNHAPYLRQCLDGFMMQKTDFAFEVIVHDDASTDGSVDIIREYAAQYPHIIKPIYETENQYSKKDGAIGRIMDAAVHPDAEYIAMCEGDDYWIDPLKLQKQVSFLEKNPQFGLCYTKVRLFNQQFQKLTKSWGGPGVNFHELLKENTIPTLTVIYRKKLLQQYRKNIQPEMQKWLMGDYPMWLWFSYESQIKFLNEETGVYRILVDSASHSINPDQNIQFWRSTIAIKRFFCTYFGVKYKSRRYYVKKDYQIRLKAYAIAKQYKKYIAVYKEYIKRHPLLAVCDVTPFLYFLLSLNRFSVE